MFTKRTDQLVCLLVIFVACCVTEATAQPASDKVCTLHPGDHLIGEDADNYYCSAKTCAELPGQIQRDEQALQRQQKSNEEVNQELSDWTKKNATAQQDALRHARDFFVDTVTAAAGEHFQNKLDAVENAFAQRAPMGETWQRRLEKAQELERQYKHLSATTDGIKLARYPGQDVMDTWGELEKWATGANADASVIDTTIKEFNRDPEVRQILKENSLNFAADGIKLALKPFAQGSVELGKFVVQYGYDAKSWAESRARIMQNIALDTKNLAAVCMLSRQMKIDVRDHNVCLGKYPGPNDVPPQAQNCQATP